MAAVGTLVVGMLLDSCFPTGLNVGDLEWCRRVHPSVARRIRGWEYPIAMQPGGRQPPRFSQPRQRQLNRAAVPLAAGHDIGLRALVVLLGPTWFRGAWNSTPFTVGSGQRNIDWAFRCTRHRNRERLFKSSWFQRVGYPGLTCGERERSVWSVSDHSERHGKSRIGGTSPEHLRLGSEGTGSS